MSKLFYDHLIILEELEHHIKSATQSVEEKEELWNIVDEIIHHRVLGCILEKLPDEHHPEFLDKFHETPYDEALLEYLSERINEDLGDVIGQEIEMLEKEILEELKQGISKH